jgi:hypothetical protein
MGERQKKTGRFEKGQSGNPKGRPRKSADRARTPKHITEIFREVAEEAVVLRGKDGELTEVSGLRAVMRALRNKAIQGSPAAMRTYLDMAKRTAGDIPRYEWMLRLQEEMIEELQTEVLELRKLVPPRETHGVMIQLPNGALVPNRFYQPIPAPAERTAAEEAVEEMDEVDEAPTVGADMPR